MTSVDSGEEEGRTTTAVGGKDHHHASDHPRSAALPGGFDPIVERELRALGSRPPGGTTSTCATAANHTHQDPSHPARQAAHARGCLPPVRHLGVEPLMRASHANLALPAAAQGSEESVCVGSDYYGSMFSLTTALSKALPPALSPGSSPTKQQPPSTSPYPTTSGTPEDRISDDTIAVGDLTSKPARAAPKIFDKVRAFEERLGVPGAGPPRLARAASFGNADADGARGWRAGTGLPEQDGRVLQGAAQRRSAFKQRASSLEDTASLAQRVQSFQSKFNEELQRIKRLVGKPGLRKACSMEQLAPRDAPRGTGGAGGGGGVGGGGGSAVGKLEPIPPQVVKKLEARKRVLEEQRVGGGGGVMVGGGECPPRRPPDEAPGAPQGRTASLREPLLPTPRGLEKISSVAMETEPVHQLPAGPVTVTVRTKSTASRSESLGAKPQSVKQPPRLSSSTTAPPAPQPRQPETPEGPEVGAVADQDPPGAGKTRHLPQHIAVGRDPAGSLSRPAKPARSPGPSVGPSVSPLLKKRKGPSPLPQILVEEVEEEMEETKGEEGNARTRFLESSGFPMEAVGVEA
ncbi:unnamed protein product [Arctogadus glacialis]